MPSPAWLDRSEYSFTSRFLELPPGRMHYVDEGSGDPLVLVHGNPTWSFLYRKLIRRFAGGLRCIAPDHVGFGLSDKPEEWEYRPEAHARNLAALMDTLELDRITLVVHDWGGPIGLSFALQHPERVRAIMLLNTWMWPVRDDWYYVGFSRLMGGVLGRYLIRHRNFFARRVLPAAFGERRKLTPDVHRHYLAPLATPADRVGCAVFPPEILGSNDWLGWLWSQRASLQGKEMAIVWGMKDIAFRAKELERWTAQFPGADVVRAESAGHFVQEEEPDLVADTLARLLERTGGTNEAVQPSRDASVGQDGPGGVL